VASVEDHLRRWTDSGVIDAATAARIGDFEATRPPRTTITLDDRPGVVEAVLYLGLAVVAAGAFVLLTENWNDLQSWARISALAVPAVLMFVAGLALRSFDDPGFRRAGGLAWLVAVGLVAGTVGVAANEADLSVHRWFIVMGAAATVTAAGLWAASPTHPQVLGLGIGLGLLAGGVGNLPDDFSAQLAGMAAFGLGLAGVALAEAGWLTPQPTSRLVFGLFAIGGPWVAGLDGSVYWAELLVFVVGAGLIALAVNRDAFLYMVIAVTGMFVGLITFVFEHLADSIGVALSLLLSGAAIVAGVLLLAALRPSTRRTRP
jgi:hypothetical protein